VSAADPHGTWTYRQDIPHRSRACRQIAPESKDQELGEGEECPSSLSGAVTLLDALLLLIASSSRNLTRSLLLSSISDVRSCQQMSCALRRMSEVARDGGLVPTEGRSTNPRGQTGLGEESERVAVSLSEQKFTREGFLPTKEEM
jgi:hypothetical protein